MVLSDRVLATFYSCQW